MITERSGLIVWLSDSKPARNLEKFGTVHYISKKMNYAVLYVHANRLEEATRNMQRLPYVKKVERSFRSEIKTEYGEQNNDNASFDPVIPQG